jgi:hypothetical protein
MRKFVAFLGVALLCPLDAALAMPPTGLASFNVQTSSVQALDKAYPLTSSKSNPLVSAFSTRNDNVSIPSTRSGLQDRFIRFPAATSALGSHGNVVGGFLGNGRVFVVRSTNPDDDKQPGTTVPDWKKCAADGPRCVDVRPIDASKAAAKLNGASLAAKDATDDVEIPSTRVSLSEANKLTQQILDLQDKDNRTRYNSTDPKPEPKPEPKPKPKD